MRLSDRIGAKAAGIPRLGNSPTEAAPFVNFRAIAAAYPIMMRYVRQSPSLPLHTKMCLNAWE